MGDAGTSLRQALSAIASRLQQAGIERARAEARLLAAHALGVSLESVVGYAERELTVQELVAIDGLALRRVRREPMSQILGYREFFGREFVVTADVLTPRPDSEALVEAVLFHLKDRDLPLRVLDLGVGSGCLLLTLLCELPEAWGTGVEISPAALAVAATNAERLRLGGRCDWISGDWSAAVEERFDVIVSNPPYIPTPDIVGLDPEVSRFEPRLALDGGVDGLDFYRRLLGDLDRLLASDGLVALEVGQGQADDVAKMLQSVGLSVRERRRDLAGIERCVLATKS